MPFKFNTKLECNNYILTLIALREDLGPNHFKIKHINRAIEYFTKEMEKIEF